MQALYLPSLRPRKDLVSTAIKTHLVSHILSLHVYGQFASTRDELQVFDSLTLTEFF
jgi:hypothetical protein